MTEQYEQGAVCLNNGMTLPYVWVSLHLNARLEMQLLSEPRMSRERDRFAQEIVTLLKGFEAVEAEHWIRFCTAAGQTTYGAVAQSWCKGATLAQVLDGWRASGFPLKPLPEYERPARFINPALLPDSRKLSGLIEAARPDSLALCAMIAHSDTPLDFDLPLDWLKSITDPQLAAFLKSRMLRIKDRSSEQDGLIAHWHAITRGSDFDIW